MGAGGCSHQSEKWGHSLRELNFPPSARAELRLKKEVVAFLMTLDGIEREREREREREGDEMVSHSPSCQEAEYKKVLNHHLPHPPRQRHRS